MWLQFSDAQRRAEVESVFQDLIVDLSTGISSHPWRRRSTIQLFLLDTVLIGKGYLSFLKSEQRRKYIPEVDPGYWGKTWLLLKRQLRLRTLIFLSIQSPSPKNRSPNCCCLLVKNIHRWPGRCRLKKKTSRCAEVDSGSTLTPAFVDVEGSNLDRIFASNM